MISDLTPLSGLTALERLYLVDNMISDLTPLSDLTGLRELSLGSNQITDLTPLSSLTALTALHLAFNDISDLRPLSGLTVARELSLSRNRVSDLGPLSRLTALRELALSSNEITDLKPLVENQGLAAGDLIIVRDNPLSPESLDEHIPVLRKRGVNVAFDRPANQLIANRRPASSALVAAAMAARLPASEGTGAGMPRERKWDDQGSTVPSK